MRRAWALGLALVACGGPRLSDGPGDAPSRARAYLDAVIADGQTPGLQYLVVDSTGPRFEYAAGLADLQRRAAMEMSTTLMAYSMSKTLTAVAVLQLVAAGKVGLDDPVSRYVTGLPFGDSVTVRRLIAHTSGIPNPIPLRWAHLAAAHATFDEGAALREQLEKNRELDFAPGARYKYSNLGYWLLGGVVERASGQTFPSYVSDHLFAPLGAPGAELGYRVADEAHHATGYLEKYSFLNLAKRFFIDGALVGPTTGSWVAINAHYPNGPAFGGVVGNARGFGRFLQDQLKQRSAVLDSAGRALLYERQRAGGKEVPMTLGWHVSSLNGETFYFKEGGGGGFHLLMRLYPQSGIGTVLMTNATGFKVRDALDQVDRAFVGPGPR